MFWITWRSIVEILFFSSIFYSIARWLRKDVRLLRVFVAYCSTLCVAQWLELQTVTHVLTVFAPAVVMLWVVFHQDTLAKRLVTVRNITPVQPVSDWLAVLFGSLLNSVQKNRPAFVVIEKQDSLRSLLASSCGVQTEIQKNLLELLLSSTLYEPNKLVWVNHRGQLLAINAYWHASVDDRWISEEVLSLEVWKQDALLLAHKTDAIVLYIKPETRTVTLICQQKVVEDISVAQALLTVKTYLFSQNNDPILPTLKPKGDHGRTISY
jgi:hypothetical protein